MESKPKFLSVRETPIFREQIDELVKKLGENQSRVIVRAIGEAHAKYCGRTKQYDVPSKKVNQ